MDHVLEVYGFAPSVKTMDLESLFWAYRDEGLAIRWVDDTHAAAVFRRPSVGKESSCTFFGQDRIVESSLLGLVCGFHE
jgi:hypothetical protein